MKRTDNAIVIEDIADIAGVKPLSAYWNARQPGFPKPIGKFLGRTIWDRRAVEKYFRNRVDGRTPEGRKRKRRRGK